MRRAARERQSEAWRLWWPFVLLCVVRGSRWMLSEALPGSGSTLATEALGCGSAAALCLLISPKRTRIRIDFTQITRYAAGGALMIAGPLLGLLLPGTVSGASIAMALALTPVVVGVVESALHHNGETLPGRLWPGLAAIAGLLLLLAEPSLSNPRADFLLALTPILTAAGVGLFCSARETAWRLPSALLGACAVLGFGSLVTAAGAHVPRWPEMGGMAAGLDALEAFLSVLALGRLSAARWSAQFALVPLLVLLEGLAMLHDAVPARVLTGLVLLGIASAAMLIPPAEEPRLELGVPGEARHSD